jgi:hypothetical protein
MSDPAESQEIPEQNKITRAAFYIDGFNFYHAVNDLGQNHLKWIDLWQLGENLIPKRTERLVKVVFCTAYNKNPAKFGSLTRHQKYVKALKHLGVTCVLGHYIKEPRDCRGCGRSWEDDSEKQSDINVALHMFHDAHVGAVEHAYLLTADSDQTATVKFMKEQCPACRITSVAPPDRNFSTNILPHTDGKIALTAANLERVVLPRAIIGRNAAGQQALIVERPPEYAPPAGWVKP